MCLVREHAHVRALPAPHRHFTPQPPLARCLRGQAVSIGAVLAIGLFWQQHVQ
jgi:hypothetical protein